MLDEVRLAREIARSNTEFGRSSTLSLQVRHLRAVLAAEIMAHMFRDLQRTGQLSEDSVRRARDRSVGRLETAGEAEEPLRGAGIVNNMDSVRADLFRGASEVVRLMTNPKAERFE